MTFQKILPLLFLIAISFATPTVSAQSERFYPSVEEYRMADKKLAEMTLDEKIGQLVHIGINAKYLNQDNPEFRRLKRDIEELNLGGIVVFAGGIYETVHLVNRMQQASQLPLLISADFETGVGMRFRDATNFPWNMAVSATGKPDLARKMGVITARESRALGVQQVFAPVIDVNNNADNPVINVRSYGEDPEQVARFGAAFSDGLQSGGILATAKHFPGHGDTAVDSHRGLPVIDLSRKRLDNLELYPFRKLIENGVGSVMISHISMPQLDPEPVVPLKSSVKAEYTEEEVITEGTTIPATLSKPIVDGILRKEMGFEGLIVTDAMDMSGLTLYFDYPEAAARAFIAGNDVLLKTSRPRESIKGIRQAVQDGRISIKRLDESVRRILAWKYKLGLFDNRLTKLDEIDSVVSNAEARKLSAEIANRAITLVKKDAETLPVKPGTKVALINITNGDDLKFIGKAFESALKRNGIDATRITIDGRSSEKEIKRALEKAAEADVVIAGLFGRVRSGSKNSTGLPSSGTELFRILLESKKPMVTVAFGNPYLILNFPEIENYIVAYGAMNSLQSAVADKLVGKSTYYGKLPISIGEFKVGTGLAN